MSSDNLEQLISIREDACLRKYCIRRWGEQGENVLHRAYLKAFESIATAHYNPDFQLIDGKERKRSAFYNYVVGILKSALEDEMLNCGLRKNTKQTSIYMGKVANKMEQSHGPITVRAEGGEVISVICPQEIRIKKRVWEKIEVPSSVTRIDDDGKEHGIEEYADPDNLEAALFSNEKETSRDLDAKEITTWFIGEINKYAEQLQDICDYEKWFVLRAICTGSIRLKNVATEMGLTHQNMTKTVSKIYVDLAQQMAIPRSRVQNGIDILKSELTLHSQLNVSQNGY